jgi:hypothetical protein
MKRIIGILFALLLALAPVASDAQIAAYLTANPGSFTGTTSLTGVMLGMGTGSNPCTITAQTTGVFLVTQTYVASNNTASDGFFVRGASGLAATAPANGAVKPTDWVFVGPAITVSIANPNPENGAYTGIYGPYNVGTKLSFDLQFGAVTGGTATVAPAFCTIVEIGR